MQIRLQFYPGLRVWRYSASGSRHDAWRWCPLLASGSPGLGKWCSVSWEHSQKYISHSLWSSSLRVWLTDGSDSWSHRKHLLQGVISQEPETLAFFHYQLIYKFCCRPCLVRIWGYDAKGRIYKNLSNIAPTQLFRFSQISLHSLSDYNLLASEWKCQITVMSSQSGLWCPPPRIQDISKKPSSCLSSISCHPWLYTDFLTRWLEVSKHSQHFLWSGPIPFHCQEFPRNILQGSAHTTQCEGEKPAWLGLMVLIYRQGPSQTSDVLLNLRRETLLSHSWLCVQLTIMANNTIIPSPSPLIIALWAGRQWAGPGCQCLRQFSSGGEQNIGDCHKNAGAHLEISTF